MQVLSLQHLTHRNESLSAIYVQVKIAVLISLDKRKSLGWP
ncbi:hypothetical protein [Ammoniphilus sp. 3BR4]